MTPKPTQTLVCVKTEPTKDTFYTTNLQVITELKPAMTDSLAHPTVSEQHHVDECTANIHPPLALFCYSADTCATVFTSSSMAACCGLKRQGCESHHNSEVGQTAKPRV